MIVTLSVDNIKYSKKPENYDAKRINATITQNIRQISLEELGDCINHGQTFCPAVFTGLQKKQSSFKSQQLFALDFDGGITMDAALERAREYNIEPAIIYETFSSTNKNRFRFIFCHCTDIPSAEVARTVQFALCSIFPEADKSSKDFTKIYYGGKNAIVNNNVFDTFSLLMNMTNRFKSKDKDNNLQRYLRTFSRNTGLVIENGVFKIELSAANTLGTPPPLTKIEKNDGIVVRSITIYMDMNLNTSFLMNLFYEEKKESEREVPAASAAEQRQKNKLVQHVDFHKLAQRCPLFDGLVTGQYWLCHIELFGLMTNLAHIKSGRGQILDSMAFYPDWYDQKIPLFERFFEYAARNNYNPMSCDNFCPYADKCSHRANIIETIKPPRNSMMRISDPFLVSLDEAYSDFKKAFYNILSRQDIGIHVIKAQTGIGKTHTYLEYLQMCDTPCLIAVPTNKLKEEIYTKALDMGIPIMMTPSIENIKAQLPGTKDRLDHLYTIGNEEAVNAYLREYGRKSGVRMIKEYFRELETTYGYNGHIITTHAKLLHMKEDFLLGRTIIIDEDILNSVYRIETVPISEIRSFLNRFHTSRKVTGKLDYILSKCENLEQYFLGEPFNFSLDERMEFFSHIEKMGIWISSNILGLCEAKSFHYDDKSKEIQYIREQKLYAGCKYVVLSATANKMVYEKAFAGNEVSFYQCREAVYAGTVHQHHDRTYSRTCVVKIPDFYEELRSKHNGCPVISFKDYDPLSDNEIHMGATEGRNDYTGKNIVVAGTPHKPEFVAKLLGLQFGVDINDTLSTREIVHNGYRFYFMTYENTELRTIQLWIIESELEQCIGRARLLRHDAQVHLYSNLPVRQCKLVD